jgi:hypothetical protein
MSGILPLHPGCCRDRIVLTTPPPNRFRCHTGTANPFGIAAAQERGRMFIQNKDDVYRDMIIGVHQRPGDLHVRLPLRLYAAALRYCVRGSDPVLNCVTASLVVSETH